MWRSTFYVSACTGSYTVYLLIAQVLLWLKTRKRGIYMHTKQASVSFITYYYFTGLITAPILSLSSPVLKISYNLDMQKKS